MPLIKRNYTDGETVITAQNLNDIQDAVLALEDGLFVMDNDKSGEVITITDASRRGFKSFRIYGNTTQAGTPAITAPVEPVSAGNGGSIAVNVTSNNEAKSMTIETPTGLPGVPVASGGNYTDSNGKKWVCDEIDLYRGVYIQRVASETITLTFTEEDSSGRFRNITAFKNYYKNGNSPCLCNIAEWRAFSNVDNSCCVAGNSFYLRKDSYTLDSINAEISNTPITVVAALSEPIETPLPAELLTAYAALHTYKDDTTVTNDAGAHMSLEYYMDAKKYIDSLQTNSGVGRIVNISLPAAKWSGSGTLYSQVVSISSITENSQVNLTPTVEQMSTFYEKDITFVTENDGGVVTVYVIGQKPQNDYTIPANIVEVRA